MAVDTSFDATGPVGAGFVTVFQVNTEPPPFNVGGVMNGVSIGVLGFSGSFGPSQQNSYTHFAGVEGASFDSTGVAGISLQQPGVYGQVESAVPVPDGLRAGVLGAAGQRRVLRGT